MPMGSRLRISLLATWLTRLPTGSYLPTARQHHIAAPCDMVRYAMDRGIRGIEETRCPCFFIDDIFCHPICFHRASSIFLIGPPSVHVSSRTTLPIVMPSDTSRCSLGTVRLIPTDLDLAIDPPLLTVDHVDRGLSHGDLRSILRPIVIAIAIDPATDLSYRSGYRSRSADPIVRLMPDLGTHRTSDNMVFLRFLIANPNDWPLFRFWLDSLDSRFG